MPIPLPPEPPVPPPQDKPRGLAAISALEPLTNKAFGVLWSTWLVANICMWMNDVAAAWMMTSLTHSPIWVALVQTAATLPVFLLGLPSGALADILDRRRYFIATQFWVALVAVALCVMVLSGKVTPPILLALVFANGIGLAMRWPVFAALIPELVPRNQLPAALALNGVAMNTSRIVGPLTAGALIASFGSAYVFILNAVLSLLSAFVIMRWRREHVPDPLGRERLQSAIRVGLQFVGQSARLKTVFLLISLFFFHSTAVMALLPLIAQGLQGGGAGMFTLLLAAMGSGAILAALLLPRVRQSMMPRTIIMRGVALQAISMAAVAVSPSAYMAVPAMFVCGMAWITTANTLSVAAQLGLPNWVRARGMSMFQMAIMGASAAGAAVWGQIATVGSVRMSVLIAAASGILSVFVAQRMTKDRIIEEDFTPSRAFKAPQTEVPPKLGHVVVNIEYCIDPVRGDDFLKLMQESRRSRLRQGALSWELMRDLSDPGRYVEQIVDESWIDHLRRFDRVTASDVALRDRKLAFHIGPNPPLVSRWVVESGR